ncbi:MAG: DUF3592 domain-containing protein [Planctomycetes bacterium]|nr:DUF3592 domain-containing protein [Planctomycetota bacterium]MBL7041972.1 DUF3592 domain-containing protein [Pirellulaceae bacterium]
MTSEQASKNPWWSYTILIMFVACFAGGLFAPNLFAFGTLVMMLFGSLGCLFFLAIGVFIFWTRLSAERRYRAVDAVVLSKRTEWKDTPGPDDSTMRTHGPVIEYEYKVGGATYRSSTVMSGGGREKRSGRWAQRRLSRYEIGQTVQAYYSEEEPSRAFLIKGDYGATPFALLSIGLGGLGILAWVASMIGVLLPFTGVTVVVSAGIVGWFVRQIRRTLVDVREPSATGEKGMD